MIFTFVLIVTLVLRHSIEQRSNFSYGNWVREQLDLVSSSFPQHRDSNRNSTASAASEESENGRQNEGDEQETLAEHD